MAAIVHQWQMEIPIEHRTSVLDKKVYHESHDRTLGPQKAMPSTLAMIDQRMTTDFYSQQPSPMIIAPETGRIGSRRICPVESIHDVY
jgi:hypothetical protein